MQGKLHQIQKKMMGTTITIKAIQWDEPTVQIQEGLNLAMGEFDRIVEKFTRFNESSELSNLNRNSGVWTQVSEEFFVLVEKMIDLAEKTNGAFDPTVIDFLEVYGYDKNYDFSKLDKPELDQIVKKTAQTRKSYKKIKLDKERFSLKLQKDQRIDLGGIGKGYAVDCAFAQLEKVCSNFLIDGGGDIRVLGKNQDKKPWAVELKAKTDDGEEVIGTLQLTQGAVASSGSWAKKIKQFHHIINPKTGKPVEQKFSTVFVKADDATTADAWATAIFVGHGDIKIPKELAYFVK